MVYQYAGVLDNGLSFHQLEYRNPSRTTPGDLMCALRALGATDAIIQSHTRMSGAHGPRDHWAANGCLNWPSEGQYRFRLVFPSQTMAENVYATFCRHAAGPERLELVPQAPSAATLVDTKVRIGRLPPLTTTDDILAGLLGPAFPSQTSTSPGMDMPSTPQPPLPSSDMTTWANPVTVSPICPRDRTRSKSQHKPSAHDTARGSDTHTRGKSSHQGVGQYSRSAPQHSAPEERIPQAWQLPLQRHPAQAPRPTADLSLYLRRELSTYVDQRIKL
ncbi:hypothetical protein H257_09905 [Aphanomyces astaci]|uniref:Uncharacterized protein n=1 Tax=Aphanomyces astaci TaxID=112090 RepID=W4G9I1_APHAT|nr:hypothetical protein H257_09905 [Aphanomyces astaci]ETV75946.1 hypothetical protein H257_09905 [Aphanomyces astaci]|eukprot:XP_009834588.1 hypothetical protein H257_09905 [Aphanomyces astaci]